jgi:hypothetical protein
MADTVDGASLVSLTAKSLVPALFAHRNDGFCPTTWKLARGTAIKERENYSLRT